MIRFLTVILVFFFSFSSKASHVMGGDLTWSCDGTGKYVFELVFYRDCNGAEINAISENLKVWNHPTLTTLELLFVSREDISPSCSPVVGSPAMLECGTGSQGGNGIGAIEKIIYRSVPTIITGVPPAQGWVFTYENFSRSLALTNISNPSTLGITLSAKIFEVPGANPGSCVDSSPKFLQEPHFVSCAGEPYVYNMNAIDPDFDSLYIEFGIPFDHFPGQATYDPPNSPSPVPFEPGYSYLSPTPDGSFNASNIPAQINSSNGELTFTSNTIGNFIVKVVVKAFRNNHLIAEVEREMQLIILPCTGTNQAPVFVPPFINNSFDTIVEAGNLVDFSLMASDFGLLHDGTPQTLSLTASGPMFGAGFTSTSGCDITPCATLNGGIPISGVQQVSVDFSWQTSCDHLVNQYGVVADVVPYNFVFKVKDDYCQVPKISYATVTINVLNPGVIPATQINCIETDATDQVTINWTPVTDPFGTFVSYEIYSLSGGLLASFTNINTNQFSYTPGAQDEVYISVRSGCDGLVLKNSDTVSNIWLNVTNPANGTAILQWNKPQAIASSNYGDYYRIYREYPTASGNWILIDSTNYNTPFYKDTIDVCYSFLKYKVILPTSTCDFSSTQRGDIFEDMITPAIPVIYSVGFDTTSNNFVMTWNQNSQEDTYGYVIYSYDNTGFLVEIDTVWGLSNTSYSYTINPVTGPLFYSVAAFDSCFTTATPVTYQTSAKAQIHGTIFLSEEVNMCDEQTSLNWTPYEGSGIVEYQIWALNNASWVALTTTPDTFAIIPSLSGESYEIVIEAILTNGSTAFSSPVNFIVPLPQQPSFHYFKLATVNGNDIELYDYIDHSVGITEVLFQRMDNNFIYSDVAQVPVNGDEVFYKDNDVSPDFMPWTYRAKYIDSCGNQGTFTQEVTTMHLSGTADEIEMINTISWTPYLGFDGAIVEYRIYRALEGVFDPIPIATVPDGQYTYVDNAYGLQTNGNICYRIEAVEALNFYNFSEQSSSNDLCLYYKPYIYVPNAFTPGGINPIFIPVISNASSEGYQFEIFSRWGQRIFESSDLSVGWDGLISNSGQMATNDVYLYTVSFEDGNGNRIFKRGFVSLLK